MKTFVYLGKSAAGERIHGTIDAADLEQARSLVEAQGKSVTVIAEAATERPALRLVRDVSVERALETVSTVAAAGVPVEEAFETVADVSGSVELRRMFNDIADEVRHGQALSDVLEAYKVDPVGVALVRAGERVGDLPFALGQLASQLRAQARLRQAVRQATLYPRAVVGLLAVLGLAGVVLWRRSR